MFHHPNGQTSTASIQIPNMSSPKQIITPDLVSGKIVKSFSNNSYSEQRLASSITNYLYSSLSPPSPTTYKLNDFKCSESFKDNLSNQLYSLNKKSSSTYLPDEEVQKNDQKAISNEIVQKVYTEIYSNEAQVDDILHIMSFHPNYLQEYYTFSNYIMYSQGALSLESRHYISIMASARHKCYYLVNQQENEFISIKGNKKWLTSHENLPQKLRDLFELNKLLCHQPWLINRSHIEKLVKNEYSNNWSITELFMAVTILSHFHALSGFVFGLGINDNYLNELCTKNNPTTVENERMKKFGDDSAAATAGSGDEESDYDYFNCNNNIVDYDENTFEFSDLNENKLNRTMSNSSASSCEIGIEMLLKEMQMIQADDNKQLQQHQHQQQHSLQTNKLIASGTNTIANSPQSSASFTNSSHYYNYLTDSSNCSSPKYSQSFTPKRSLISRNNNNNNKLNNNNENDEIDSDLDYIIDDDNNNNNDDNIVDLNKLSTINIIKPMNSHKLSKNKKIKMKHHHSQQQHHHHHQQQQHQQSIGKHLIQSQINAYMLKYAYEPEFTRVSFKHADQSLRLEFFTWERQGYSTACSIYSEICELLEKKFKVAATMTYNTMGSHKYVDTSLFRRAIWLYIQSLFGVRYDDYDYSQIKQLIGTPLRNYIKILTSCPERVSKKDYDKIMKEFTHSEKVHVNIVIMEARIQASLLYFLRAINSYYS